jgi:hypothetical protein
MNLPTWIVWVGGYAPSCLALNGTSPQKLGGHGACPTPKGPGSLGGVCMARWQDSIHFVVMGVSPIVDDQIWQVWKKPNHLVPYSGLFGFDSFRAKPRS